MGLTTEGTEENSKGTKGFAILHWNFTPRAAKGARGFPSLYKGRQGNRVYGYYTLLLVSAINAVNVRYDLIALFGLLLWNKSISSAYRVADKDILEASNPRPP